MSEIRDANKRRNLQIARNEEKQQILGSVRISAWAIAAALVVGVFLFSIGWIAYRL
ncbi:MAG: hypothetical protein HY852_20645 [Bradyrhizobium sp.]|uniref:hypothetical protein n=1 Tax=Bradyrhizobium sp. TaxID=376 RepID=UPI0025C39601|nr:hypothetical protein [Bradyrhizobium sp.]MBI5264218.1 hypothetical protein [Bradyrhizobium sp.]